MPKRVGGVAWVRPRCQKSTHELPWPSGDRANFFPTKSARTLLVAWIESGQTSPDAKRSRMNPTAALYSAVSRSLINLPAESSFQLLGALNTSAKLPMPNSVSLVPKAPIAQRFSCGRFNWVSAFLKSSAFLGTKSLPSSVSHMSTFLKKLPPRGGTDVIWRWIGIRYSAPSTAEMEFFQAGVGSAARLGYSLAASPARYGVRSAHLDLKKPGRFGATE